MDRKENIMTDEADEKTYIAKVKVTRIYEVGFTSPDAEQAKQDIETLIADGEDYTDAKYTDNIEEVLSIEQEKE
jgi:hypothetical protein